MPKTSSTYVSKSGGCGVNARGRASLARETVGHKANIKGSTTRQTANKVVHCTSFKTKCPNTSELNKCL